jgi:Barstar (barnase inhibitor)
MKAPRHKIYNRWIYLSDQEQEDWLIHANRKHFHKNRLGQLRELTQKKQATIDGVNIKTLNAFLCAMGEAAGGPRGYFGFDLLTFHDCCWGRFGLVHGFHLIWRNHKISKRYLDNMMLFNSLDLQIRREDYLDEEGLTYLLQHKKEAEDGYTMYEEIIHLLHHAEATVEES